MATGAKAWFDKTTKTIKKQGQAMIDKIDGKEHADRAEAERV